MTFRIKLVTLLKRIINPTYCKAAREHKLIFCGQSAAYYLVPHSSLCTVFMLFKIKRIMSNFTVCYS